MQLRRAKSASVDAPKPILTKTSCWVWARRRYELRRTMPDLRDNGGRRDLGSYLRPTRRFIGP